MKYKQAVLLKKLLKKKKILSEFLLKKEKLLAISKVIIESIDMLKILKTVYLERPNFVLQMMKRMIKATFKNVKE